MKIYKLNNIITNSPFKYVVIVSFAGISCKIWNNIITAVSDSIESILFIHLINSENFSILNDQNELIDFYRLMGVKNLVIEEFDFSVFNKHHEIYTLCYDFINKSEKVYLDKYMLDLFDNGKNRGDLIVLPDYTELLADTIEYLQKSKIKQAAISLGYLYQLRGKVIAGNRLGRKLGYPTANLLPNNNRKLIPEHGVYGAIVTVDNKWYQSMVNIGERPTLKGERFTIEAHLFDFNNCIYNQNISIHFGKKLRDEKKFENLEILKKQLAKDKKLVLSNLKSTEKSINIKENFCFML